MEFKGGSVSSVVLLAYDATKDHTDHELRLTINDIRMRGDILLGGDKLIVIGVLHSFPHPMGYQMEARADSLFGTNARAMEEEVQKKTDIYYKMLQGCAEHCKHERVSVELKIIAGMPPKRIILQEAINCKADWVIIDRQLRKDMKFYLKHIPCKVALIQDSLSVEPLRLSNITNTDILEQKFSYSVSKPVEVLLDVQDNASKDQFNVSCGNDFDSANSIEVSSTFPNHRKSSDVPVLCSGCGITTALYIKESMRFRYSEIQAATSDFSKEQLLGEGGYGHVYKGRLKDGQVIAAKVRKEASWQGDNEFRSEVYVLSFARHRNIIMLLGYCNIENHNILVYEYICNKSLYWHLFSKSADPLEWHKRRAIAIGTAKGLRFLHEECRGCPIIHRDLRPSNILLTHDFVPMIGDFGLAKWKTGNDAIHTRVVGTLGYLAPEYVESGIVSVRTDVYAYGVVLLQLISGRKIIDNKRQGDEQSLLQWAESLIGKLALHQLIDPRIGEVDDITYELYNMATTAYMCVRRSPEKRPSMGEVVRLLEGESNYIQGLAEQFILMHRDDITRV